MNSILAFLMMAAATVKAKTTEEKERKISETERQLRVARDLCKERWVKGHLVWKLENGMLGYCAIGLLAKAAFINLGDTRTDEVYSKVGQLPAAAAFLNAIPEKHRITDYRYTLEEQIWKFNDSGTITKKDVLAVFDRAIENVARASIEAA